MPPFPDIRLNYHVAFDVGERELIMYRGPGRLPLTIAAALLLLGAAHAAKDSAKAASKIEVKGELKLDLVRGVIKQHIGEVRLCYETELAKNLELAGQVTVSFTISAEGKVSEPKVKSSTLNSPAAEKCITDAVGVWEFPKPKRGTVAVEYPFVLVAAEPEADKSGPPNKGEQSAEEAGAAQDKAAASKDTPPPSSGPGSLDMEKELEKRKKGGPGYQDKGVVRSVIRGKREEIQYCFQRGLSKKPTLEGQVMVQFVIGASGEVFEPKVQSSSLNHPETEQCIVNRVRSWRFPAPEGGRTVITIPFAMRSDSTD